MGEGEEGIQVTNSIISRWSDKRSCTEYCIGEWCMGHRPLFWLLERNVGLTEEEFTGRLDQAFEALEGFTSDGRQTGVAYDEHSLEKLRHKMSRSIQEDCDYDATTTVEVTTAVEVTTTAEVTTTETNTTAEVITTETSDEEV